MLHPTQTLNRLDNNIITVTVHYTFAQCLNKLWTCNTTCGLLSWTKHFFTMIDNNLKYRIPNTFLALLTLLRHKHQNIKFLQGGRNHGLYGTHKQRTKTRTESRNYSGALQKCYFYHTSVKTFEEQACFLI